MGNFSRDTFNKLKHYVGVRLQQGVPVIDADWNEMEDIRKYELRAFLKWFVGDGVPAGNDGFCILPGGSDNDLQIRGGNGGPDEEGRCLVDGWDAINESTINYTDQALFDNPALDAAWEVDPLPPLTTPAADRTDTVFLDVWEREVNSSEDTEHLVNPAIGMETCVRIKREWVVRVAENATAKPPPPAGHAYLELAHLTRRTGVAAIQAADITDLRLSGLKMFSINDVQQIVADAFGTDYSLDHDGQSNLKVSLREAINAVLRGGLPSTPTLPLATEGELNGAFAAFEDRDDNIWIFWLFSETDPPETIEIRHRRFSPESGTWDDPVTVTTNASIEGLPAVIEDGNGDFWLFWTKEQDGDLSVAYNHYIRASNSWQDDTALAETPGFDNHNPVAVADQSGDIWAFWLSNRDGRDLIYYRRFDRDTDDWEDEALLSKSEGEVREPFVLQDTKSNLWLFWTSESGNSGADIWCKRFDRESGEWEQEDLQITTDVGEDENAFALEDKSGDIWAFWISDRSGLQNIHYKQYRVADEAWDSSANQLTTVSQSEVQELFAFEDSSGDIWVFWYTSFFPENSQIYYKRHNRDGGWGPAVALATGPENDGFPIALQDVSGDVWVFWTQTPPFTDFTIRYTDWKVVYRKLIPSI